MARGYEVKVPPIGQLVLLFFLGGVFLHFLLAGARTFTRSGLSDERGGSYAELSFVFGGTVTVWFLGLYQPIHLVNGIVAAAVLLVSLSLYEWARHTIWLRRFHVGWSGIVPEELCEAGPYRYVRHPIYASYLLAFLAAASALPHLLTGAILGVNVLLLVHGARDDERSIAASALAGKYAAYRERTGMFWPRFGRRRVGS
jgi:protein-S-isoprenylcysteine O-methyltransferase Ste14